MVGIGLRLGSVGWVGLDSRLTDKKRIELAATYGLLDETRCEPGYRLLLFVSSLLSRLTGLKNIATPMRTANLKTFPSAYILVAFL
jgi:hypothetical protein